MKRPLDLSVLTGEEFEDLIEGIFRAKTSPYSSTDIISAQSVYNTVVSVSRSGRGHDEGRDLLVTTAVRDCISQRFIRWVVQCKHKALSGRSVGPGDFTDDFSFSEVLSHHDANGYLLVCSTRPSTKLQARLDKLTQDGNINQFASWDFARICEEVFRHEDVMKHFFKDEYRRQQGLVEGEQIRKRVQQHEDAISHDARAALKEILEPGASMCADEMEEAG